MFTALGDKKFDVIVSNPPYVKRSDINDLQNEVKSFEPKIALDGGEDGLVFYRAIMNNFAKNLEECGFFLFEIGYDQADDLRKIADSCGFDCKIFKDLGGCDRAALCRVKA